VIEGRKSTVPVTAKVADEKFASGQLAPFGKHTLTIDAPGFESFQREFRTWFGTYDLGDINLTRSKGTVEILAEPSANEIRISGPAFKTSKANATTATFGPLVVGDYDVSANFGFFTEERRIVVKRNEAARVEFKPSLGVLALSAQPA